MYPHVTKAADEGRYRHLSLRCERRLWGESGRARTDDPLLIGLDMPTCLTGVSLGYIVP